MNPVAEPLNKEFLQPNLETLPSEELTEHIPVPALVSRRQKLTRIFQIGFNKCGTRSLYRFLQRNGIYTAHFNRGKLARKISTNIENGMKPLNGFLDRYVAFTDMQSVSLEGAIEGAMFYKQLYQYYPNSYFILNTRDKEGWLSSRRNHGAGVYLTRYGRALGNSDEDATIDYWSKMWDRHHEDVQNYFADKSGRLIVYDIKKDHSQKMVDFLSPDFATKAKLFLHEGDTRQIDGAAYATNKPINRP